jgi:hypothetical protein
VCPKCVLATEIVRDEGRAAGNLKTAGWSALGLGAVALASSWAMVGVITYLLIAMSMVPAIFALNGLVGFGNERFTKYLTRPQRATIAITSIAGIALCFLGIALPSLLFARGLT